MVHAGLHQARITAELQETTAAEAAAIAAAGDNGADEIHQAGQEECKDGLSAAAACPAINGQQSSLK